MKALTCSLLAMACIAMPALAQTNTSHDHNHDTVNTTSGLRYVITQHGSGRHATMGKVVIAHYTGTLTDGTVFDDSRKRNEPFAFTLGQGQVIRGWDEAFALMRVGDHATLIIPSHIAYGEHQRGPIPPNSTLIFDVELVDLKDRALQDELLHVDTTQGIAAAVSRYRELKAKGFEGVFVNESQLNMLGYKLLNRDQVKDAIEIFKLNVEAYPESSNVYDSLGEACMNNGDQELAIANYEKSLELDPKNANAVEMLKKLKGK